MARDWTAIRAAFIAGVSYTELSNRYGIPRSTIVNRAYKEKWGLERQEKRSRQLTPGQYKLLFDGESDPIEAVTRQCLRIVNVGLDKVELGMSCVDPADTTMIRAYCASLKDLQTVAGAFAGMTRKEIAARIESLEKKQALLAGEDGETGVVMIPVVQMVKPAPEGQEDSDSDDE